MYFFQRWSFFAPPPTFDYRLYFIFYETKKNKIEAYEILDQIAKEKQEKAPFNKREDILDYLISNSINSIMDNTRELKSILDFETNEGSKIKTNDSLKVKYIIDDVLKTKEFITLEEYAKMVGRKNNIELKNTKLQIRITKTFIPKFSERYSTKRSEETALQTTFINL